MAMSGIRNIVVGTDFSEAARAIVRLAGDLAAAHSAQLTIVHAIDPMITTLELPLQTIMDDAAEGLAGEVKALAARGVAAITQRRIAKAWWAIEEAAKETHADLVVIGSHGRSGFAKLMLGSTADRVLRSCSAPVLLIPLGREGTSSVQTNARWTSAMVGIDFSEESKLAAAMAARLLQPPNPTKASLTLFHTIALTIEFRGPDVPVALPQHWDQAESAARGDLEKLAATLRSPTLEVNCTTYRGYASDGIMEAARTRNAGFIAMGTHGRGAVNRMLLGSVAERVLHHSERPVLTVRHHSHRS